MLVTQMDCFIVSSPVVVGKQTKYVLMYITCCCYGADSIQVCLFGPFWLKAGTCLTIILLKLGKGYKSKVYSLCSFSLYVFMQKVMRSQISFEYLRQLLPLL